MVAILGYNNAVYAMHKYTHTSHRMVTLSSFLKAYSISIYYNGHNYMPCTQIQTEREREENMGKNRRKFNAELFYKIFYKTKVKFLSVYKV